MRKYVSLITVFAIAFAFFLITQKDSYGEPVTIEYKVSSGGQSVTQTNTYDLNVGSTAQSSINIGNTNGPSISSHNESGPGDTHISITANDGSGESATGISVIGGDQATIDVHGDTANSTNTSISASGSAQMGLITAESSSGDRDFCPFTGEFQTGGTATNTGVSASAAYTDPRMDIFVVTDPALGHCQGCIAPTYGTIGGAVTAANADNNILNTKPDWIVVDEGTYNEGVTINNFEDNSALTSVWGAGDTVVDTQKANVNIIGSNNFKLEGLTVKKGFHGIFVQDSNNVTIKDNAITENDHNGIHLFFNSIKANISGNNISDNVDNGIFVIPDSSCTVNNNNITGNNNSGLFSATAEKIDATNNWWGPGGTGDNAGKPGEDGNNAVTGVNVDYDPWAKIKF
ncbi:MAG: right-handed parallel beta-helix repeat-containing protein [candidate division Zixibacteria bacterium]|nr:right-handed parallel beta-helix repeat-containing protein [candidate division Zixibacteria bacterium]